MPILYDTILKVTLFMIIHLALEYLVYHSDSYVHGAMCYK